jgi:ribonuclease D
MALTNAVQGWQAGFAVTGTGEEGEYPEEMSPIAQWVERDGEVTGRVVDPLSGRMRSPEEYRNFTGYFKVLPGNAGKAYELLRIWRYDAGKRDGCPLYTILSETSMQAIAQANPPPVTVHDLAALGVPERQIDQYGEELLEVCARLPA